MPTLTVDLGVDAASDDVYLIVYEDDTYAACWDGNSWEIPNAGSFDSGGVAGVHQGDGVFTFEFPASITEPGTYPVRVFEYPGIVGSYAPDDPQLTYDSSLNAVTVTGAVSAPERNISYDPDSPSVIPSGDPDVIVVNEGRDWVFTPDTVPDIATTANAWKVTFTGFGLDAPINFTSGSVTYPATVGTNEWTIRALVTPAHTATFLPARWGTVDLWYQPGGDDAVIMRRRVARTVA